VPLWQITSGIFVYSCHIVCVSEANKYSQSDFFFTCAQRNSCLLDQCGHHSTAAGRFANFDLLRLLSFASPSTFYCTTTVAYSCSHLGASYRNYCISVAAEKSK